MLVRHAARRRSLRSRARVALAVPFALGCAAFGSCGDDAAVPGGVDGDGGSTAGSSASSPFAASSTEVRAGTIAHSSLGLITASYSTTPVPESTGLPSASTTGTALDSRGTASSTSQISSGQATTTRQGGSSGGTTSDDGSTGATGGTSSSSEESSGSSDDTGSSGEPTESEASSGSSSSSACVPEGSCNASCVDTCGAPCHTGECQAILADGQPCAVSNDHCVNDDCQPVRDGGTGACDGCAACGGYLGEGEPCVAGDACFPGTTCVDGFCGTDVCVWEGSPCGGEAGAACCNDDCNAEGYCGL